MTMPANPNTTTNPNTNPAPETKTETPPAPEAKPVPARPRVAFSGLSPSERLYVCRIAANQGPGGKLPLEVREAILSDYEGIPAGAFAPDPTGPGWADRLANGAEAALMVVIGTATGLVGLFLVVEAAKAVLRSTGLMAPATPAALPTATVAPDEVGINEAK